MSRGHKKSLYNWWINADFRWLTPSVLGVAAVTLAVMDAVDPYRSDYRMWAVGCIAAMLFYGVHVGPKS